MYNILIRAIPEKLPHLELVPQLLKLQKQLHWKLNYLSHSVLKLLLLLFFLTFIVHW